MNGSDDIPYFSYISICGIVFSVFKCAIKLYGLGTKKPITRLSSNRTWLNQNRHTNSPMSTSLDGSEAQLKGQISRSTPDLGESGILHKIRRSSFSTKQFLGDHESPRLPCDLLSITQPTYCRLPCFIFYVFHIYFRKTFSYLFP